MESVIRGMIVYLFLLTVFRLAGKRTLSESTPFDLVLLLIISEATQQAMVGDDHSMKNAMLLILTLVGTDIGLSLLKKWIPGANEVLDGRAVVLLRDGTPDQERLSRERVDVGDIMEAARLQQGITELKEIALAVLERGGQISIVPVRRLV